MSLSHKIYLAGPEVFLPNARAVLQAKVGLCKEFGFTGVTPFDNDLKLAEKTPWEAGLAISQANEQLIGECDLLIANATPFRGPSMDVGTAFEMGVMRGLGRPVLAYTNILELYLERMVRNAGGERLDVDGTLLDQDGLKIEEHGFVENLMIDGAVISSFGTVVRHRAKEGEWFTDLTGFRECVKMASDVMARWRG